MDNEVEKKGGKKGLFLKIIGIIILLIIGLGIYFYFFHNFSKGPALCISNESIMLVAKCETKEDCISNFTAGDLEGSISKESLNELLSCKDNICRLKNIYEAPKSCNKSDKDISIVRGIKGLRELN